MAREPFVDQNMCISCGLCIDNLPSVFRYSGNGKAECYDPTGAAEEEIQNEAVEICPVSCICWK